MPTRTTEAYEKIAIDEYLKSLSNLNGAIITYPDPPDCLIEFNNGIFLWIEVSSVYRNETLAKNLNSTWEPGQVFSESLGTNSEYQSHLVTCVYTTIRKKDSKKNYGDITSQYGQGVLIIYIDDPLCSCQDFDFILNSDVCSEISCNNFHSIYLYIRPTYSVYLGVAGDKRERRLGGLHKL